jgi:hypothetical protein
MKIVGTNVRWVRQVPCPTCKVILEFTNSEVQQGKKEYKNGLDDYYSYIVCPQCQKEIRVERNYGPDRKQVFDPC